MKKLKNYIVENYENQFSFQELMSEGIPKLFLKIEAVKKKIEKLEAERKAKFAGSYASTVNSEKDPVKRAKLVKPIKDISIRIAAAQKNLSQLLDMEDKYISQMAADAELDTSVFEDITIGHEDNEPGMLKADLSTIERYAEELGEMMAEFDEMEDKVDFPHWWQSKIVKAKDYIVSAQQYLKSELDK
tara:strand:- start:109 stop:672 length:564 start_codon:yes stop_codon:yes gene_type:complete